MDKVLNFGRTLKGDFWADVAILAPQLKADHIEKCVNEHDELKRFAERAEYEMRDYKASKDAFELAMNNWLGLKMNLAHKKNPDLFDFFPIVSRLKIAAERLMRQTNPLVEQDQREIDKVRQELSRILYEG